VNIWRYNIYKRNIFKLKKTGQKNNNIKMAGNDSKNTKDVKRDKKYNKNKRAYFDKKSEGTGR